MEEKEVKDEIKPEEKEVKDEIKPEDKKEEEKKHEASDGEMDEPN